MSDDHRERLNALRDELLAALTEIRARAGTVDLDQSAVGRVSRVDALQQQAMARAQEQRVQQRLETVENALKRLNHGRYGECLRCGDDIGLERLRARPEAPFCLACSR